MRNERWEVSSSRTRSRKDRMKTYEGPLWVRPCAHCHLSTDDGAEDVVIQYLGSRGLGEESRQRSKSLCMILAVALQHNICLLVAGIIISPRTVQR